MEQRDVPLRADRVQEPEQRARALRELEAEQPLVLDAATRAADHEAHVELRHLVVAHVDDRIAGLLERANHGLLLLAPFGERHADEELRIRAVVVAIVELSDAAAAEYLAEAQEAALLLRDLHGEERLALAADVGALCDVSQAVEVHVRAAIDGDERALAALL